jgi:hypothetical protein
MIIEWDADKDVWYTQVFLDGVHDHDGVEERHATLDLAVDRIKAWRRVASMLRHSGGFPPPDADELLITQDADAYTIHTFSGPKTVGSWQHAEYVALLESKARVLGLSKRV